MRIFGKNPVLERLKSQPKSIRTIYVQEGHPDAGYIQKKANKWGIAVCKVPGSKIQKLARDLNTQGLVAEVEGFSYLSLDDLLQKARTDNGTVVFLDELTDPQNLGGIIRSLGCLGNFFIVLPTHHSVEVTPAVLRVACGADNYVSVAKVANLSQAILAAKDEGFWIAGAVVKGGQDIATARLNFPLALVVGSEQKGIRDVIRRHLDIELSIPMAHERLSLNVSHATTIFCYEIARQRKIKI